MSAPFDPRSLGLKPGELASVIQGDEPLHHSQAFGWHHDAWLVSGSRLIAKDHVTNEAHWDAWGPWDACQTDFKPR
jgi:hypothetical protein